MYFLKLFKKGHVYLLPYVDDMLLISKEIGEINKLKLLLQSEFDMKGLNPAKKILGMDKRMSLTCFVFIASGQGISWKANLQSIVALPTTEIRYVAAAEAVKRDHG